MYVGTITDQKGRWSSTGNTRIAGGLTLLTECGVFDDIYNGIIVGLQGFTKRGENGATAESRAHIALQDSIVARQSKKTAHTKAQLEKPAESVGLRWHGLIWQEVIRRGF